MLAQGAWNSIFHPRIVLKINLPHGFLKAKSPTLGRRALKKDVTASSHQRLDYFARAFTRTVRREIFRDAVFL